MKARPYRHSTSDPVCLEVVAETETDRVALADFLAGVKAPLAITADHYMPGQAANAEALGPAYLRFHPAAPEKP